MRTAASAPYSTPALIIRSRILGEKDRVVTLLSPERGKFSAAARGARATKSKLAALSQPFVLGRFLFAHGRSLDILTQGQIEEAHGGITANLVNTAWANYLCELCDAVPEHQPDDGLFELIVVGLHHLNVAADAAAAEMAGRWFECRFLAHLGYAPTVGRCVVCSEKIVVDKANIQQRVGFSPARGGTICEKCGRVDVERLHLNVQALRAWHRLERLNAPPPATEIALSTAASRDFRDGLRRSIRLHLDLKMQSLRFLDDVLTPS
jgi:DNA repair protein RecO (recombination protein O)